MPTPKAKNISKRFLSTPTLDDAAEYSDLVFVVGAEGAELHCHKCIVGLWSPYFLRKFSPLGVSDTIILRDEEPEDFRRFVQMMYPGVNEPVTAENVEAVCRMACEYEVLQLKRRCELFLLRDPARLEHALLASKYSLWELRDACIAAMSRWKVFKSIVGQPAFFRLDPPFLQEIALRACGKADHMLHATKELFVPHEAV
jgi:hypothetical protein